MKVLRAADRRRWEAQLEATEAAVAAAREAAETFNERINTLLGEVEVAIAKHWMEDVRPTLAPAREALAELEGLRAEIHGCLDEYASERSERWHDSEKGGVFGDWMFEWETEVDADVELPDDDYLPFNPEWQDADVPGELTTYTMSPDEV